MQRPRKIGGPRPLIGMEHGKSAVVQSFINPRTDQTYDHVMFTGPPVTTIVFPLTEQREVVAVRQFRHGADSFSLELPGGVPNGKETARQNAEHELIQETGYSLQRLLEVTAYPIFFDPASWNTAFQPFMADGCWKTCKQSLDDSEDIEVVVTPIEQWLRLIARGEVRDAKSIVTTILSMRLWNFQLSF